MAVSDRTRNIAVAVTAVAQLVVGLGAQFLLDPDSSTAAISDDNRSPLTPAGYAFSIWGLIFTACLALAAYQALPAQRERAVHRRTGWWLVAAFTASAIWVPIFSTGVLWLAQLVILVLLGCLVVAARRLTRLGPAPDRTEQLALRLPVTIYLGWVSLATVAGFGATFRWFGMPARGGWVSLVAAVLLLFATAFAIVVVGRFLAVAGFALAACWALVALAIGTSSDVVRVTAVVAGLLVLAVLVLRARNSRRPATVLLG
nr:tryptophan-rich sensory protein [uncultured Friedmanniella sp.]